MSDLSHLKNCPFCERHDLSEQDNGEDVFWIVCENADCGAEGPFKRSREVAHAAWNLRPSS